MRRLRQFFRSLAREDTQHKGYRIKNSNAPAKPQMDLRTQVLAAGNPSRKPGIGRGIAELEKED